MPEVLSNTTLNAIPRVIPPISEKDAQGKYSVINEKTASKYQGIKVIGAVVLGVILTLISIALAICVHPALIAASFLSIPCFAMAIALFVKGTTGEAERIPSPSPQEALPVSLPHTPNVVDKPVVEPQPPPVSLPKNVPAPPHQPFPYTPSKEEQTKLDALLASIEPRDGYQRFSGRELLSFGFEYGNPFFHLLFYAAATNKIALAVEGRCNQITIYLKSASEEARQSVTTQVADAKVGANGAIVDRVISKARGEEYGAALLYLNKKLDENSETENQKFFNKSLKPELMNLLCSFYSEVTTTHLGSDYIRKTIYSVPGGKAHQDFTDYLDLLKNRGIIYDYEFWERNKSYDIHIKENIDFINKNIDNEIFWD